MIVHEQASGGEIDLDCVGCCEVLLPRQREECLVSDSIMIDERLRESIAETETEVKKRLGKLRSRLATVATQIAFDFSPFLGEAERYANELGVLKDRHAIESDDPHLAVVVDSKRLGRHASDAASYLMTHATALESRTRHDLLSDLWLVNLAHELSQTLRTVLSERNHAAIPARRDTERAEEFLCAPR
jgi:hypothetical protein